MKIGVIGSEINFQECRKKFSDHSVLLLAAGANVECDVLFNFEGSMNSQANAETVFINVVFGTLTTAGHASFKGRPIKTFGFCGLPTFLNREILEVTGLPQDAEALKEICAQLGTKYQIVGDEPGMVTPRIICMIINEAFRAADDKTASRHDIDVAMKLGTSYPFGPFEWCAMIGAANVAAVLRAIQASTGDSRYEVCTLLASEANTNPH